MTPKQREELNFWKNIRENGTRGFSPDQWRSAHIHFKQYSLTYIERSISDLKNKVVVEVGCGPSGIVPFVEAKEAIGIDQLLEEYKKLWDLAGDNVSYVASEIEAYISNQTADIIICWNALDHVRDLDATLHKINSLLKNNGELWLMVNLEDHSDSKRVVKADSNSAHPYCFSDLSLTNILEQHGFRWIEKRKMRNCLRNMDLFVMGVLRKQSNSSTLRKKSPKKKRLSELVLRFNRLLNRQNG